MGFISDFMADPRNALIVILLALPGRLFAISAHEYAHARMAYRFGDDTASMLGRMTLNPLKHIDPLGFIMLYIAGFGWAKPVPINPRNFKGNYRKADLLVSIAGITMNFLMFLAGAVLLYAAIGIALSALPSVAAARFNLLGTDKSAFITTYEGVKSVFIDQGDGYVYWSIRDLLTYAPYAGEFIQRLWGNTPYYLFEMVSYFVQINIVLAIFNLIPLPPLDGYHVLNDLVLKRELFAGRRAMAVGQVVLIGLLFSGALDSVLGFIIDHAFQALGAVSNALLQLLGVL